MSDPAPSDVYTRRQYRRPPIEDAICELRLSPQEGWNPALPGLLYERLRNAYPGTPRQQVQSTVEVRTQEQPGAIVVQQAVPAVEFPDGDDHRSVTVGPGVLTVRVHRPYPGWETFSDQIQEATEAISGVLTSEPTVTRVGLRYINKVEIPENPACLPDYFVSPPTTPDAFPETLVGLVARFESFYNEEDRDVRLLYTFASTPTPDESTTSFVLDFDVIEVWDDEESFPGLRRVVEILPDLKRRLSQAFEATLTDRTREVFDAQ
jgi:uncharacterized protein (TIGR04255 family)